MAVAFATVALVVVVVGWPAQAIAQFHTQTHIDSLYPTSNGNWPCVNGVGGTPAVPTNGFCLTDSAVTSWYTDAADGSEGDILNPGTFELILEREFEPTALTMSRTFNPVFSGESETDIFYQRGVLNPGVLGRTWCNDAVEGTRECDQQYVRFDDSTPHAYVICHETGHAVGLTHGNNADPIQDQNEPTFFCMRTPLPDVGDRASTIGAPLGTLGSQLTAHYENQ